MTIRVGINGFGRIGRQVVRAAAEQGVADIEFVAVNDLTDTKTLAHLFKYDSVHGTYEGTVTAAGNAVHIDGRELLVLSEKDPAALPWKKLGADLVLESTGRFTDRDSAKKHLDAGARPKVTRLMMRAPDAKSAAAHAASVAPVVTTSSTSTRCAPRRRVRTPARTRNAEETLRRRSSGVNRVCVSVLRARSSTSSHTGTSQCGASARASAAL